MYISENNLAGDLAKSLDHGLYKYKYQKKTSTIFKVTEGREVLHKMIKMFLEFIQVLRMYYI